jgi:hypothetical protein
MGETMTLVLDEVRMRMAVYFVNADWQERPVLMSDDRLMSAAQHRAIDMATRDYFDHVDPEGHWPNFRVRSYDYELPNHWLDDANNTEGIGKGFTAPEGCLEAMYRSDDHRPHVTGNVPFFFEHTRFGVGHWERTNESGMRIPYYVLITAPPEPEPEPEDHNIFLPGVYRGRYKLVRIG